MYAISTIGSLKLLLLIKAMSCTWHLVTGGCLWWSAFESVALLKRFGWVLCLLSLMDHDWLQMLGCKCLLMNSLLLKVSAVTVQAMIAEVIVTLEQSGLPFGATKAKPQTLDFYPFKHEPKDYNVFWNVRKGLIPIVGGARETGRG